MDKLRTARGGLAARPRAPVRPGGRRVVARRRQGGHPGRSRRDAQVQGHQRRHRRRLRPVLRVHRAARRRHDGPALRERRRSSATRRSIRSVPRCSSTSRSATAAQPRRRRVRHVPGRPDRPRPADEHRPGGQSLRLSPDFYAKHAWIWQGNPQRHLRRLEPEDHLPRRGRQRRLTSRSRRRVTGRARDGPGRFVRATRLGDRLVRAGLGDDRLRATVATHAAISARRRRRRAWRGCARRGRSPSSARRRARSAISAFVRPVGDQPRDLELADGQRPPRLVLEPAAAAGPCQLVGAREERLAPSAAGGRPDLGEERGRVGVSVHPQQAAARGRGGPTSPPRSARARPSRGPPARAPRAPPTASLPPAGQPVGVARAPARRPVSQPARCSRAGPSQRWASSGRRAAM